MSNTIFIHDFEFDGSITFLTELYNVESAISNQSLFNQRFSNSKIRHAIRNADEIWMLGHGNPNGLLSRKNELTLDFNRFLIDSRNVQDLRNKTCIGIWCHANQFAERYGLHGLFSSMVISEQQEALDYFDNYRPTKEECHNCNMTFVFSLKHCLLNYKLWDIPKKMMEMCPDDNPINQFNFNSLNYY